MTIDMWPWDLSDWDIPVFEGDLSDLDLSKCVSVQAYFEEYSQGCTSITGVDFSGATPLKVSRKPGWDAAEWDVSKWDLYSVTAPRKDWSDPLNLMRFFPSFLVAN